MSLCNVPVLRLLCLVVLLSLSFLDKRTALRLGAERSHVFSHCFIRIPSEPVNLQLYEQSYTFRPRMANQTTWCPFTYDTHFHEWHWVKSLIDDYKGIGNSDSIGTIRFFLIIRLHHERLRIVSLLEGSYMQKYMWLRQNRLEVLSAGYSTLLQFIYSLRPAANQPLFWETSHSRFRWKRCSCLWKILS